MPPRRNRREDGPGMQVACLWMRVAVRGARSLKEKRMVVKSLKDRLAHRFGASVAEVGDLDALQVASLGASMAGGDSVYLQGLLARILDFTRLSEAELLDHRIEVFHWEP